MKPKAVILGAGVAGLSAALHLARSGEYDIDVIEKTDRVGGLATSFSIGPAIFDFGPHAFHSKEPHVVQFFQEIMNGHYFEIDKDVAINFRGKLYPYPLNPIQALRNMSFLTSFKCGVSYFWNLLTNRQPLDTIQTAEEFFVRNYGWELYRIFFERYTHKVWGIHPRDLSAQFMKNRIPSANILQMIRVALTGRDIGIQKPNEVTFKIHIFYPKEGSIQFPLAMAKEIEERGGRIRLRTEVRGVEVQEGRVQAVRVLAEGQEQREPCKLAVSTIPLPELIQRIEPRFDPEVFSSAKELAFRPIVIACLWINKPNIFSYQTLYYTNRIFNRLAQMNSYSPHASPEGTCGVTAELTCELNDPVWQMDEKELLRKVISDMVEENLLRADEVREGMILRHPHGYPIYRIGFEPHLRRLLETVHAVENLYVSGRQGMFNYAQMHFGVSSGMAIADCIHQAQPKPPLPTDLSNELPFA